jgi:hypothetical protein
MMRPTRPSPVRTSWSLPTPAKLPTFSRRLWANAPCRVRDHAGRNEARFRLRHEIEQLSQLRVLDLQPLRDGLPAQQAIPILTQARILFVQICPPPNLSNAVRDGVHGLGKDIENGYDGIVDLQAQPLDQNRVGLAEHDHPGREDDEASIHQPVQSRFERGGHPRFGPGVACASLGDSVVVIEAWSR